MNRQALVDRIVTGSDHSLPDAVAEEDELVARFGRIACGIRFALIWKLGLIVVAEIFTAKLDLRCEMVSG
jgi:hypothetical protein